MYGTRVFTHFPFLPLISLVVISGGLRFLRTVDALYNFKSRAYSRYHNNWPPPISINAYYAFVLLIGEGGGQLL